MGDDLFTSSDAQYTEISIFQVLAHTIFILKRACRVNLHIHYFREVKTYIDSKQLYLIRIVLCSIFIEKKR